MPAPAISDSHETWALELSNAVLNHTRARVLKHPHAKLRLTRAALQALLLQGKALDPRVQDGSIRVEGDAQLFATLIANTVRFEPDFGIVTP